MSAGGGTRLHPMWLRCPLSFCSTETVLTKRPMTSSPLQRPHPSPCLGSQLPRPCLTTSFLRPHVSLPAPVDFWPLCHLLDLWTLLLLFIPSLPLSLGFQLSLSLLSQKGHSYPPPCSLASNTSSTGRAPKHFCRPTCPGACCSSSQGRSTAI